MEDSPWDNPWDNDPKALQDTEWSKISSDFQNAGYREGITAGKESALQQGFDDGFAQTGAPLGRQIGILRGAASALLSLLNSPAIIPEVHERETLTQEARDIAAKLGDIRFSDIAPPDLEAEQHAREHLLAEDEDDRDMDLDLGEELTQKREMESLEDMLTRMGGSFSATENQGRPTMEDVAKLEEQLNQLCSQLGLPLPTG